MANGTKEKTKRTDVDDEVDDDDDALGEGGRRALAAERRTNRELRKTVTGLETKLEELTAKVDGKKDDGKDTSEESSAKLAKLEKDLADERLERLRLEVGAEKGLTPKQARRLTGASRDDLLEAADDLIEDFGIKPGKGSDVDDEDDDDRDDDRDDRRHATAHRRPVERLRGGGRADDPPEETDPRKLAERLPRV